MNFMPNFTLRPIKTIMEDTNLKLKLIETHLDKAFADVFFDDLDDDIREQEFFPDLRETIVDAASSTDDPFTAFMHLKNDGWHSGGRELTAFEELFRLMDLDRFELLKMRSKQMGYGGPFGKKAFLFKEYGSEEIMLGFQPDELLPECEFASVFFEDGLPDRDNEGKLLMMIGRWTEVSSIEGEITDESLLNELREVFQEKRDELLSLEGEAVEYETDIDDYLSSLIDSVEIIFNNEVSSTTADDKSERVEKRRMRTFLWYCSSITQFIRNAMGISKQTKMSSQDQEIRALLVEARAELDSLIASFDQSRNSA